MIWENRFCVDRFKGTSAGNDRYGFKGTNGNWGAKIKFVIQWEV